MLTENSDWIKKWSATSLVSTLTLLLTLTLGAPAAAQATSVHANGAFAQAFSCSQSTTTAECISVSVFRATTSGAVSTGLSYEILTQDLNTGAETDTIGDGTIPNSSFQVNGKSFSVNADTNIAGFTNIVCTIDPAGNITCNSTTGGVVNGTWTEITPPLTSRFSGSIRTTSPALTSVLTGTSDNNVALANVNVLGAVLTSSSAVVGTNHNTTINITVQH